MQSPFQLLITTLSAGLYSHPKQRLISLIRQAGEDDWQNFLNLSDQHNVSSLLHSSFHHNGTWSYLPAHVRHSLDNRYHNTVAWSLKLSHSLEQVVPAFQKAGIPFIPWKGPALSQRLFNNVWSREYVDLDFLVTPQYRPIVNTVLKKLAYNHEKESLEPPASLANYNDHCQSWRHQSSQVLLEIHWKPFPSAFRFIPPLDRLFTRCSNAPFQSVSIPQLSLEDEFILLVGHGAKHHWSQLNWLCDFTQFVILYGESLDWEQINHTAIQSGFIRIIKTALFLTEKIFKVTPPADSFPRPATDPFACRLSTVYAAQIKKDDSTLAQNGFRWKYHRLVNSMLARERYRDRLPVILSALAYTFAPNQTDHELCLRFPRLPINAWVIRPFRLIGKYALHPFKKNSNIS